MCYNIDMQISGDPIILLSTINMLLRDRYSSLDELCAAEGVDKVKIERALAAVDYRYDGESNQFV